MKKLKPMKYTEDEQKARMGDAPVAEPTKEEYPYGLSISLDDKIMEKLGVSPEDFPPGSTVEVACVAKVTNISVSASEKESSGSVHLQITHMHVEPEGDKELEAGYEEE